MDKLKHDQLVKTLLHLREYTTMCLKLLMLIILPGHLFYFLPTPLYWSGLVDNFCKWDHIRILFSKQYFLIGLCITALILTFIFGIFITYRERDYLCLTIPRESTFFVNFERDTELSLRLKRLLSILIVLEIWNVLCMMIPLYSVFYFFSFRRPNGDYFVNYLIKADVVTAVEGMVDNYGYLLKSIVPEKPEQLIQSAPTDSKNTVHKVSELEEYSENIFHAHVLAPILSFVQVFVLCCGLVVIFIHSTFIITILRLFRFLKLYSECYQSSRVYYGMNLRSNSFQNSFLSEESYEQPKSAVKYFHADAAQCLKTRKTPILWF